MCVNKFVYTYEYQKVIYTYICIYTYTMRIYGINLFVCI